MCPFYKNVKILTEAGCAYFLFLFRLECSYLCYFKTNTKRCLEYYQLNDLPNQLLLPVFHSYSYNNLDILFENSFLLQTYFVLTNG